MNYILSAEHIQKKYGGKIVLHDVCMQVEQRAIYGLIGKNGSGKTTLLRILTGLIKDYDGTVYVAKTDSRKRRIAVVIDDPSLFLNMSAFENLKEQAHLLNLQNDGSINEVLRIVGLANCNNKPVKNFSLGIQRLKLAMALLEQPDVLILDEPMNGLDPDGIADLRALLLHLSESGMTILISSHILRELEQIATHLGILHDGMIVKEVSAKNAFQNGGPLEQLYEIHKRGKRQ